MKEKIVLITGGSSGIGKALAWEFARNGSTVVVTGRQEAPLKALVADLKHAGAEALALQADVSREDDCRRVAEAVLGQYGRIDVLVNNAGISMRALFADADLKVIRQVMETNFFGTVNMTKYCLPSIAAHRGSIVGISSIAGYRGLPARTGYSASKFAMHGFLEALRTELLPKGVHVLIASPGFTASNIRATALAQDGSAQGESPRDEDKMMSAEECAWYIYKATAKRRKLLVLTGQGKLTVWLNKFFPGFMDRLVYNALAKEPDSPLRP
jgi:short-subunit dehydrogenase